MPLVRISLRMGITVQDFSEIVTETYVDVARSEFGVRGRVTNTSRVALLTGLSRAKVVAVEKAVKDDNEEDGTVPDGMRHVSRLLLGWHTDSTYLDHEHKPLQLAIDGNAPSFQSLYEKYSGRVAPRTSILKELINVGAVGKLEDGRIAVLARQYIPQETNRAAVRRGCLVVGDLTNTISRNLYPNKQDVVRFERTATNQLVPRSKEPEFRRYLAKEGQVFLERIDDWLVNTETEASDTEFVRLGAGVFEINSQPHVFDNDPQEE